MAEEPTFSAATETHSESLVPLLWTEYSRKSERIGDTFVALKTPLDARFTRDIAPADRWNCKLLVQSIENLGLVIDLTETGPYYFPNGESGLKNIEYKKLPCSKDDAIPTDEQISRFIQICDDFLSTKPAKKIIGVHCIYGHNPTGYLICAYLCQKLQFNIHEAIERFAQARPPGIKRQDFINALIQKYSPVNIPKPLFVVRHPDIIPVWSAILLNYFRLKYQQICTWNQSPFPGSKPTQMTTANHDAVFTSPYKCAQMTNGVRYMMLIENENEIHLLDQMNNVFQINHLDFPRCTNTLLDGEFVVDCNQGNPVYRYLVFDLVIHENKNIGQRAFSDRLKILDNHIIKTRDQYLKDDHSIKHQQPFQIQIKHFFELSQLIKLSPSDIHYGLIFQSESHSYQFGRSTKTFKCWRYPTVHFRLQIIKQSAKANLFLHNTATVSASLLYSQSLDRYNNRIIECSYFEGHWHFKRFRPDRDYPDSHIPLSPYFLYLMSPSDKTNDVYNNNNHLPCRTFFELLEEKFAFDSFLKGKHTSSLQ